MLLLPLVVLFVVVPIAELYVIIKIGGIIGVVPTLAILIADSVIGAALLRSQGRKAWRRFNEALRARRPPAREVLDGALVIFGGAFLLTPGFLTDIAGLLLLLPPTRAAVRGVLVGHFSRRFVAGTARRTRRRPTPRPAPAPPPAPSGREPYDVDGTAVEVDRPPLER